MKKGSICGRIFRRRGYRTRITCYCLRHSALVSVLRVRQIPVFDTHTGMEAHLEEVPLSKMLTMENNVKQIAPNPANTRAGMT